MLSSTARHRLAMQIGRWLGPWADAHALPPGVRRERVVFAAASSNVPSPAAAGSNAASPAAAGPNAPGPEVSGYRFAPASGRVSGCYVVVQGLHYAGPDDPRMDRFCRVLAHSGILVLAPRVRCFARLQVRADARHDVAAALRFAQAHCRRHGLPAPGVFSISFGSYPSIQVAADEQLGAGIGGLVLFGGFADFAACIRFAVSKRAFLRQQPLWLPHDPVNTPAVMINVLPHIAVAGDRGTLAEAWLELAQQTWGRPELRPAQARASMVARLAARLPPQQRELFEIGSGLRPGAAALLEVALGRGREAFAFTQICGALGRVRAPVLLAHGRDDDVIPYNEAHKLRAALPPHHPHHLLLTGMYGHTGTERPSMTQLAGELRTMRALLYAIVDGAHAIRPQP